MDIMQFDSLMEDYQIELAPANLFYDANYKVKALMRDVYADGKEPDRDDNLKKEKAICAYVLQTRYSYEDYYEGDSWRSKFINGKMGKVSESFENVSAYNEKIVVYAIYEEGNLKIIIRDIYNKDEVYKEIIDEFPNIAVGSYIIKDARVINNHLVYLNYYLGNDWKEKKTFIFV